MKILARMFLSLTWILTKLQGCLHWKDQGERMNHEALVTASGLSDIHNLHRAFV